MATITWTNPITHESGPDPFIVRAEGRYYLITTGLAADGRFLPIWVSSDLVSWTFVRGAVVRGAEGSWNRYNFWAPEILFHEGRYWLYYTAKPTDDENNAGNRVGLAVSDQPDGPYEDIGVVVDHASLDGSPFREADGTLWLYYVTDHGNLRGHEPGKLWVDRLIEPGRVAERPVRLIERHPWQEGPAVLRQADGRYRLTYSLGGWRGDKYHVVQAVGDRPDGPFVESDRVLMKSTDAVKGPGHHNFFTGPDGLPWLIYHGWDPAFTQRYPRIDRCSADVDGTLVSAAPTSTPQRYVW
jgi:beta-xylosidase